MATNVYKSFRELHEVVTSNRLSKRYDEPTYLTFKLQFIGSPEFNSIEDTNYDRMPHPLFETQQNDNFNERTVYSSINYLRDSNEFTRARLLEEFKYKLYELQSNYQWYFQDIDGIGELLTINTKRGQRVPSDFRLKIKTLEGLDLRMSYLLDLYRKIAWDDQYQRWVLPDMMRYFRLRIFISEFRTFHKAFNQNDYRQYEEDREDRIRPPELRPSQQKNARGEYMVLGVLDNILPTWVIECEQCEFDIEHMPYNYTSELSVHTDPTQVSTEFQIKVGKFHELKAYPLFRYGYLSDKLLNFLPERTRESTVTGEEEEYNSTRARFAQNVRNIAALNRALEYKTGEPEPHISGAPFNHGGGTDNLKNSSPTAAIDSDSIDPTEPNTWVGNIRTFGEAFVGNYVESTVDKIKMSPIPKLGFSLTEALATVDSKDFTQVFSLVRRAIREATEGDLSPSSGLERPIVDSTFKEFLMAVAESQATDDKAMELKEAANIVLNEQGQWEKIKDFSLATDLVSTQKGEVNIKNIVKGKNEYKNIVDEQSKNSRSWATNLDGGPSPVQNGTIFEGAPSSAATTRDINVKPLTEPESNSQATDNKIEN